MLTRLLLPFPWFPWARKKYDRSGRSSGAGVVTFETAAEAARAKDRYQGALAKGASGVSRSQAGTSGSAVFQAGHYDMTALWVDFEIGHGGGGGSFVVAASLRARARRTARRVDLVYTMSRACVTGDSCSDRK